MLADEGVTALQLRAEDSDDLAVLSACLQDALVPIRDLAYDPEARTFLFVANRFRWENGLRPDPRDAGFERILCGVAFHEVAGVFYIGFRRSQDARILSLLAVRSENAGVIQLEFSGGATIQLKVGRILCHAKDLGEPWPTRWRPSHDLDERA
jgi:Protein of unknown function (DUF2948)